jgi:hypothetical protein
MFDNCFCREVAPVQGFTQTGDLTYFDLQPQEGAQLSGALAQLQGLQLQLVHLQASVFTVSTFVMASSSVLVTDEDCFKVRTMVRSQACRT